MHFEISKQTPVILPLKAEIFSFSLPLLKPITAGGISTDKRNGLVIKLSMPDGRYGYGEASPLPGFSPDTLDDCRRALPGLLSSIKVSGSYTDLAKRHDLDSLPSSLSFALDLALWNLNAAEWLPGELRGISPLKTSIGVNALITADQENSGTLSNLYQQGFRSFKLKVGSEDPQVDIRRVKALLESLPSDITIRFDANRSWDIESALTFTDYFANYPVDYIEEPLNDLSCLAEFIKEAKVPVALDESLTVLPIEEEKRLKRVKAFILKPTIQGGLRGCMKLVEVARRIDALVVITSTFESGLAVAGLARFAASLKHTSEYHGFDTLRWLENDLIEPAPSLRGGKLAVENITKYSLKAGKSARVSVERLNFNE